MCAFAVSLGIVAVSAGSAQAAANSAYIAISTYPAKFFSATDPSTGSFDGFYSSTPGVPQRVVQLRGGVIIADDSTTNAVTVIPGDVFQIRNTTNDSVLVQTTYSGPALAASSCIGQNGFAGTRATDANIGVQTVVPFTQTNTYGSFTFASRKQVGHVRSLGEGTFSGVFDTAILAGDYLQVTQDLESTSGTTDSSFFTTVITPAATCPPPVPPVPPAKDTTPPKVLSFDLGTPEESVKTFLKSGLSSFIGIDEPAAVSQELYLDNGVKLPLIAVAAKVKKCKKGFALKTITVKGKTKTIKVKKCVKIKKKKLTLIGKGVTHATVAGVIKVVVKATSGARKALKGKKSYKLTLVTTVRDLAGNVTQAPTKKVTLVK
jgi:hypothetical protein